MSNSIIRPIRDKKKPIMDTPIGRGPHESFAFACGPQASDPGTTLISVVIPCFNYALYLTDAVKSVLSQDGVRVEVIIVDDASSDTSLAVAERLASVDRRISVFSNPINLGPVDTFNIGLEKANGEFVVRLDADDLLTPGSMARSVRVARAFPNVGLVYGHPIHFRGIVPHKYRESVRGWIVWPGRRWLLDRCRSGHNVITSPEAFMRMAVIERVGGQRPLAHTHDMELWFRIAAFSDVAFIVGADQAFHREHPGSLSERVNKHLGIQLLGEKLAAFDELFSGPAGSIRNANLMRTAARKTLAKEALRRARHEFDRGRATAAGTQQLVDFALKSDPGAGALPDWHVVAKYLANNQSYPRARIAGTILAAARKAVSQVQQRRWIRYGVYERWAARSGSQIAVGTPNAGNYASKMSKLGLGGEGYAKLSSDSSRSQARKA